MEWKQELKIIKHLDKIKNDIRSIDDIIRIDGVSTHVRNASLELIHIISLFKSHCEKEEIKDNNTEEVIEKIAGNGEFYCK